MTLICQLIALACFFIGFMNWQLPKQHPLNWMVGGFFFLLLGAMVGGASVWFHTAHFT